MNWIPINNLADLSQIHQHSFKKPQLIFKHSTRCSVSTTAKSRLDQVTTNDTIDCYYLDLIAHREISNTIAENYKVYHESPQVLLIKNGDCIFEESHLGIRWDEIIHQAV